MPKTPGERIAWLRVKRGLTQEQAAKMASITQPSWSDIERGETKSLKGTTLVGIAQTLKTTSRWIMHGKGSYEAREMSEQESALLDAFNNLEDPNKSAVLATALALLRSQGGSARPDDDDTPPDRVQ